MVGGPRSGYVRRNRRLALALVSALVCLPVAAQDIVSLKDVNARNVAGDYSPLLLNQKVTVTGTVNSLPFVFLNYSLLLAFQAQMGMARSYGWPATTRN